ncbi:farnesyl pyrophosphate synthase-like [Papilio machaon]|uniref:farnesyl pyrophosphate synthase-like n=1 Tax=Papilio machaon TaxID=76193 RepID=UPI001E6652B5|nr:farnesyl pyrophosphate synthase-like [Papilio machaon]
MKHAVNYLFFIENMFSEYYTIGRYPVQGEFMVMAYEALNNDLTINDELINKLQVMVSTTEMVQSYFFIWDDLADNSTERGGKPCWHLLDDTGFIAFSDACIMRSFINEIIRQNFNGEMCANILSVYDKVYFVSSVGQYMEVEISRSRNYDNYNMELLTMLNNLKSSFYSIKSPLLLALALSNKLNKASYDVVDDVGLEIGALIQYHNDLLDFYNEKGAINVCKSSTDIQEGKFTWVATAFLENCNSEQRRIFLENFGSADPEKVKRIIEVYDEVDITKLYKQEQQKCFDAFNKKVSKLPKNSIPSPEFFKSFQNLIRYYSQDTKNFMYDKN